MRNIRTLSILALTALLSVVAISCLEEEKNPPGNGDTGIASAIDTGTSTNPGDTGTVVNKGDTGTSSSVDTGTTTNPGDTGTAGPKEDTDELCKDGVDNDGNKFTDCDDFSCCRNGVPANGITVCTAGTCGGGSKYDAGVVVKENNDTTCNDKLDNDNNGFTDCEDYSCCRNGVPTTGVTVCTAGTCGGGLKGDAGTTAKADAGAKPTLPEVNATIKDIRTKTADYTSDLSVFPTTPKSIVTIADVVVVGSYLHSAGDVDLYIQDVAGGANTGMNVNYTPKAPVTVPAIGAKVTVKGCVRSNFGPMSIMWCGDDKSTQATVVENGTATIPAADAYAPATLGITSTTHDDHLGQPIKVSSSLTLSDKPAECVGGGNTYCANFKAADGSVVFMRFSFTYKCTEVKSSVVGTVFAAVEGAWDYNLMNDKSTVHAVIPLSCTVLK